MLPTRDSIFKDTHRLNSEGVGKDIPYKWKPKESWGSSYTSNRQNRL